MSRISTVRAKDESCSHFSWDDYMLSSQAHYNSSLLAYCKTPLLAIKLALCICDKCAALLWSARFVRVDIRKMMIYWLESRSNGKRAKWSDFQIVRIPQVEIIISPIILLNLIPNRVWKISNHFQLWLSKLDWRWIYNRLHFPSSA